MNLLIDVFQYSIATALYLLFTFGTLIVTFSLGIYILKKFN